MKNREKTKFVNNKFTWLRLVLQKMSFSDIAILANAPAIHNQQLL